MTYKSPDKLTANWWERNETRAGQHCLSFCRRSWYNGHISVGRWHMGVYGNRCLKRLSFSFRINNEFWPTPTYKQAASQKITRVLVVWNSRGCFPIEMLLLVAVRFPGSPMKTILPNHLWNVYYLYGTTQREDRECIEFNSTQYTYLVPTIFSQNVLVTTFPQRIAQLPLFPHVPS